MVGGVAVSAQNPANTSTAVPSVAPALQMAAVQLDEGGRVHGQVKSGSTPLPGVTLIAQNTVTGKRFSTTTDVTGSWSMNLPQNGRYVIRTQFSAFAAASKEAVLSAAIHDQTVNFELQLASRVAAQQRQMQASQSAQAQTIRQLAGNGVQNLNLMSALETGTDTQSGTAGTGGAALPSIAGNSDFAGESVAISGQSGTVSSEAGMDMDRRDAMETMRAQGAGPGGQGGNFGGPGGGIFGGGGFGGPMMGGPGGRRNFRGFNPGQPHGAIFWSGSNSALDAEPFSLHGQSQQTPSSGTNRFGITFMSAPYLPGLTKPSGKDTVFLSLSGQRNSTPSDQYATVPTDAERAGNISGLAAPITPVSQATALLKYFPEPNLSGDTQNYHLLTTAQTNTTQAGVRYMRSLGKNASLMGMRGGGRRSQTHGLRQSINFNYNWSHSAADDVNIFPELGGKNSSNSNSLQAGYTVGYHKVTSIFNANWNRNQSQTTNFFTNGVDVATEAGILGPNNTALNASPLNYGLPNVTLSEFTGLSQQQPNFSVTQTLSFSETLSWIHGKHNLRFGGDYRRVHRDFLGGSNATGTFTFSGTFTGSSLGDFLLGEPQETTIASAAAKSYLRENVMDLFATDDWRVRPYLTLNYGIRYEFFAPFTEKNDHLAFVDTNAAAGFTQVPEVQAGGTSSINGKLPDSLIYPFRVGFAPRVGFALRLPKQTVVRAGYGINFTNGQYATFATSMARQPMVNEPSFVNEQTNVATTAGELTLANGFGTPDTVGNYALDPHYRLPYVQVWNVDMQKTLPWGVMMNVGYNGSKGTHLDIKSAPRATASSPLTDPTDLVFNYEQAVATSRFNAGTLRVNKRMSGGVALGASYTYSHSIDNAGALGGASTIVAQNWQNLKAEEGNSSSDQRHKVSGNYLYELPFGKDKYWFTSGMTSHILEGFSVSGTFTFATGTPLTPSYPAAVSDVAHGTAGTLRPDRVQGVSPTEGAGSLKKWFNTAAFKQPTADTYGNAYGNVSRNSITGPGTISNNMTLSKTMSLGGTRSMELRATANNVFNTVQYSGVDTSLTSATAGQVTSAGSMRSFNFMARFRF
jgi:hypothetical protein